MRSASISIVHGPPRRRWSSSSPTPASRRAPAASRNEQRATNVHTLLPTDILHHPAACLLKLLPVNNTFMKKLLARTVQIAAPDPSFLPGPKHLDFVVEAYNGDLRAALNNLQLLCALPSRKIGKSGDARSKRNDALSGPPSLFNRQYTQAVVIGYYHFHLSARAVLLGLPSPDPRLEVLQARPLHLRQLNENTALAHAPPLRTDLLASLRPPPPASINPSPTTNSAIFLRAPPAPKHLQVHCWSVPTASKNVLAVEVLPFLGLLASSLGANPGADHPNDELLARFSRWEYPNARPTDEQLSEDDVPDLSSPEHPPLAPRPSPQDPDLRLDPLRARPTAGFDEEPLWFDVVE
ncbi:hypothetical protein PtA15_5A713 [Puccinia triticina]|uniref:Uncharacterized protein n=1 Tax=Puccinia triticina TaxID=208348 RepID=A0ABY7CIU0_9BASI|nr:uncharacterized protein PtA15_5A713 [Puccinia triticina]WAQ85139.1 hypothetical protein PtA15_5A713 [Puccinia triticina]